VITLHGMSSPNVRKVLIALEEIGLAYQPRHVAVFRGEQFAPAFLSLSPMAKVPVLLDPAGPAGLEPICESGAILVYLAETYGGSFLPAAGAERWAAIKWVMLQVANMGPMLGNHSHFRMIADDNVYAAARFRRQAAQVYRAWEARLAEVPWLGGGAYSIADMASYPWARYRHRHGMDEAELPRLAEWEARIAARPAVIRADAVIAVFAAQDRLDRRAATPDERGRFMGLHIPAPNVEAAAGKTMPQAGENNQCQTSGTGASSPE
jgi:GST-like protein